MLISRRAGRGERASPVLFLHWSDGRQKEKGMEKREGEEDRLGECVASVKEREKVNGGERTKGREGWKERGYIYEIRGVKKSIVAIWTFVSPCCAILCWRQINHPC